MGKTILFCREVPWRTSLQISTLRLAKQFARNGWRVIWICPPLPPYYRLRKRKAELEAQYKSGGVFLEEGSVFAYTPFTVLPFTLRAPIGATVLADRQWGLCLPSLSSVLRRSGFPQPDLLWMSNYGGLGLYRLFPHTPSIWHITDDYPERSSYRDRCLAVCRANYEKADHLVFSSPLVAEKVASEYGLAEKPVTVLPHAVDRAQLEPPTSPDPLPHLGNPRIVYLGNTTQAEPAHFEQVADCTSADVVIIGPKGPLAAIENHPRIHLLGPMPPEQATEVLKHCDIGFVNYSWSHLSFHSRGGNPMKTYEYAAAGLALLCPEMDIITAIGAPAATYSNDEELTHAARTALDSRAELGEAARAWIEGQTWDERFRQAEELVLAMI